MPVRQTVLIEPSIQWTEHIYFHNYGSHEMPTNQLEGHDFKKGSAAWTVWGKRWRQAPCTCLLEIF